MSNCQSLFGMTAVPTDDHIRAMLDPVHPSHLQPALDRTLDMLRRHGGLRAFQRLGDRVLTAFDGTEYFCWRGSKRAVYGLHRKWPEPREPRDSTFRV